jgi:excinuclease UvrABC nuclease subunit
LLAEPRAYLKRIETRELPALPIDREGFASELPGIPAVYFVCKVGERKPLYIGRTTNLKKRWSLAEEFGERVPKNDHHKLKRALRHRNIELRWMKTPKEHLLIVETLLIQIYKPAWNIQGKGKARPLSPTTPD